MLNHITEDILGHVIANAKKASPQMLICQSVPTDQIVFVTC